MKFSLVIFTFFIAFCSFADVTLIEKSEGTVSVSYFSKNRIAVYENGQLINITNLNTRTIYGFDPGSKNYFKAGFRDITTVYRHSQTADATSGIGETQKTVTIKKTGKGEYAGFPCERYDLTLTGSSAFSQICVSPQLRLLLLKELNSSATKSWMQITDFDSADDVLRMKLDEINDKIGYVVYERTAENIPGTTSDMEDAYVTVLDSVSTKPIDQHKFNIPAGYKKVPMQDILGGDE